MSDTQNPGGTAGASLDFLDECLHPSTILTHRRAQWLASRFGISPLRWGRKKPI